MHIRLNKEREELRTSGGVYVKVVQSVQQSLKDGGDWTWIQDKGTKEKYFASDFEKFSRKYAVILKKRGFKAEDVLHLVVDNHYHNFLALGGCWHLGGTGSLTGATAHHNYSGPEDLESRVIAKQIKDSNAKVVICNEKTAKMTKQAVYAVEIDTEKKIHLFSFGAVEGIDDILAQLENIDEMSAPDTVVLENSDITTCLLLGSIDHHKQAKDIDSGYY